MEEHMKNRSLARSFDQLSAELLELLKAKNYGSATIDNYRRTLSRISRFMEREGINEYTPEVGEHFLANRTASFPISKQHLRFIKTVIRRLADIREGADYQLVKSKIEQTAPPAYYELLESYLAYCSKSLNNKENTVAGKRRVCSQFLCVLNDLGCTYVKEINSDCICRTILGFANKDAYAIVRSFLQYLYEIKMLEFDFSDIVPKYYRRKALPTTYTIGEIRKLEATIDRTSSTGKRDFAVILLATRLGLRSGDIVKLKFENIDLKGSNITLNQEKTEQPLSLALVPEIRQALEEYVQTARPGVESEYIFISAYAPFERMSTGAVRHVLTGYFKSANIDITGKKHGPHSLRSSLSSSMINNDVPYEVVRRLLGHVDPNAVTHYAKLDIENLRRYAIDIHAPSGKFEEIMNGRVRQW
jgi:site-specific recombinase XerD